MEPLDSTLVQLRRERLFFEQYRGELRRELLQWLLVCLGALLLGAGLWYILLCIESIFLQYVLCAGIFCCLCIVTIVGSTFWETFRDYWAGKVLVHTDYFVRCEEEAIPEGSVLLPCVFQHLGTLSLSRDLLGDWQAREAVLLIRAKHSRHVLDVLTREEVPVEWKPYLQWK